MKEKLMRALHQAIEDNKKNGYQGFDLKCMVYSEILGSLTSEAGCWDEFFKEVEIFVIEKKIESLESQYMTKWAKYVIDDNGEMVWDNGEDIFDYPKARELGPQVDELYKELRKVRES